MTAKKQEPVNPIQSNPPTAITPPQSAAPDTFSKHFKSDPFHPDLPRVIFSSLNMFSFTVTDAQIMIGLTGIGGVHNAVLFAGEFKTPVIALPVADKEHTFTVSPKQEYGENAIPIGAIYLTAFTSMSSAKVIMERIKSAKDNNLLPLVGTIVQVVSADDQTSYWNII